VSADQPPPPRQPLPRLIVWGALLGASYCAYLSASMLVGFVQRPLERGERIRSFFVVQLLLLAAVALLLPVLGHFFPRVGRLSRCAWPSC
jgi:hypothetical protein